MQIKKSVVDLKDLESFEKKILKEAREEAKNYLRLLTKGAESIWAWWHPSRLSEIFSRGLKESPNGGIMFPFGIIWPSAMAIDAVKLSKFIDYCKKSFGEDDPIANGFIWRENGRMCYVWYLNVSMRIGLCELIKEVAKIYSLPTAKESKQPHGHTKKPTRCKIVDFDKVL